MAEEEWIAATQETLGKLISKPKMTEKYLKKPPFRFLHDAIMEVTRATTFGTGLFTPEESEAGSLSDKQAKIDFLNKAINVTCFAIGEKIDVSANKIVAGLEADKTNAWLQKLATAASTCQGAKSDEAVQRVLNGETLAAPKKSREKKEKKEDKKAAEEEPAAAPAAEAGGDDGAAPAAEDPDKAKKEKDEKRRAERKRREAEKKAKEEEAAAAAAAAAAGEAEPAAEEAPPAEEPKKEKKDKKEKERERKEKEEEKRRWSRREKEKEEEEKRRAQEEEDRRRLEEQQAQAAAAAEQAALEAEEARRAQEAAQAEASPSPSLPGTAGQPNRPMDDQEGFPEGDEDPGGMTRPLRMERPRTAGRKPPKVVSKVKSTTDDPGLAAGVAPPTIIAEGAANDDEDDMFEPAAGSMPANAIARNAGDGAQHGKLVRDLLAEEEKQKEKDRLRKEEESTREAVEDNREKGIVMGKLKRKKESASNFTEVDVLKLGDAIQHLCQAANPLGKSIDLVHQDISNMGKELDKWKQEYREASEQFQNELKLTEEHLQPLHQKIAELDDRIAEQKSKIRNSRSRISKNDQKIQSLLESVVMAK